MCRALNAQGIAIPAHISVVGFDDMQLLTDLAPSLTTIRAPYHEVGQLAGRITVGEPYEGPVMLPSRLIVRGSTGPVRA